MNDTRQLSCSGMRDEILRIINYTQDANRNYSMTLNRDEIAAIYAFLTKQEQNVKFAEALEKPKTIKAHVIGTAKAIRELLKLTDPIRDVNDAVEMIEEHVAAALHADGGT